MLDNWISSSFCFSVRPWFPSLYCQLSVAKFLTTKVQEKNYSNFAAKNGCKGLLPRWSLTLLKARWKCKDKGPFRTFKRRLIEATPEADCDIIGLGSRPLIIEKKCFNSCWRQAARCKHQLRKCITNKHVHKFYSLSIFLRISNDQNPFK
jgi:hypothetical protein